MTLDQVNHLLHASRPVPFWWRGSTAILAGLSLLLGALWARDDLIPGTGELGWLIPQLVLLAILMLMVRQARRQRRLSEQLREAFEAVQMQDWPRAEQLLTAALSRPVQPPALRAQALLGLTAVTDEQRAHQAAQRICEAILEEGTADPIHLHTARVALAANLLRAEQLTDAVALIDRLLNQELPPALRTQIQMLALFREVVMGHTDAAIESAEERRSLFRRYLGTRAGYGYGLLAAAFDRAGRTEQAHRYWRDATLLVSPDQLVHRFVELGPLRDRYAAVEYPL